MKDVYTLFEYSNTSLKFSETSSQIINYLPLTYEGPTLGNLMEKILIKIFVYKYYKLTLKENIKDGIASWYKFIVFSYLRATLVAMSLLHS